MSGEILYKSSSEEDRPANVGSVGGFVAGLSATSLMYYLQLAPHIPESLRNIVGFGIIASGGIFGLVIGATAGNLYYSVRHNNER